jgi:lipopolysaccharide export system permease protein
MPLVWRYLLKSYFQVFLLCIVAFISILLATRFQEIAKFASASRSLSSVLLFTAYQITYILPLSVPIGCLLSSIILFQKLSHSHELTAFRACGMGIKPLAYPLIIAGILMSFGNFAISSEIVPYCRGKSNRLIYEIIGNNPLIITQKDTIVKLRGAYADLKSFKDGKIAKDVILITTNKSNERLGLMTAKELSIQNDLLFGKDVTFISSVDPKMLNTYDHLVIENQKTMSTKASSLTQHMQTAEWLRRNEYLPLKLLIAKQVFESKGNIGSIFHAGIEIAKRITLGLAAFTFTMIGVSYGMEIGRYRRKKGTLWALGLAAFFMLSFVATKSLKSTPNAAILAYLLPHPIILFFCLTNMRRVSRGIE